MKVINKIILGLSLSAQAFGAPLDTRQGTGTYTTTIAAVNRLLGRSITEVYSLNSVLTGLSMLNPTGLSTIVQGDLSSITSDIQSISSIISGAPGTVQCSAVNAAGATMLLANIGMAQSFVTGLSTTLSTVLSSLTAGGISPMGSTVTALQSAISGLDTNLQAYTQSLLPCISTVTPALLQQVETSLVHFGNAAQSLSDQLGAGGVLNGLIVTVIP